MTIPRTVVVMFTDLVRSTELIATKAFQEVGGSHLDRQTRAVKDADGRLVKTLGDGVMATFASAATAVAAAEHIQQSVDSAETSGGIGGRVVRVGISAGDAQERNGDWFGAPVIEAARLCAIAQGGQILAAQVVWLLTPPDVRTRWQAIGTQTLKGLPYPVDAYQVPWQPAEKRPAGVIIADDSALLRSGIGRVLSDNGFRILGEASDGDELSTLVDALHPDVVIVDIKMPPTFTLEGIRAAEAIRASHPEIGILVLSQHVESRAALGLLQQHDQAIGYLLKDRVADIGDFVDAVRNIANGGTTIDPEIVALLLGKPRKSDVSSLLTAREYDVLALMAEGKSNRAIGERLALAPRTVETHVASIFVKLGLQPESEHHRRVLAVLSYLKNP
jgi:DNA-binding NarL/FixJ family response regulator/class 3 adenylate cyclase